MIIALTTTSEQLTLTPLAEGHATRTGHVG